MADLIDRSELRKDFCNMCEAMQPEMIDCEKKGCMSMQIIDEQPAINRWIPCSERMPKSVGNRVLVYCTGDVENDFIGLGHYEKYHGKELWFSLESGKTYESFGWTVTHWMPLPEPPEKE